MSHVPSANSEYNEADRLEQSIDAQPPAMDDHDVETAAHEHERSEESSLEANPADLEEQEQEVALDDPDDQGGPLENPGDQDVAESSTLEEQ